MITLNLKDTSTSWVSTTDSLTVSGLQKTYKQKELLLFLKYEKGDEVYLKIDFSFVDKDIGTTDFAFSKLENSRITPHRILQDKSIIALVPVPLSKSIELLKVTATLVGGGDNAGTATIWMKPSYFGF